MISYYGLGTEEAVLKVSAIVLTPQEPSGRADVRNLQLMK